MREIIIITTLCYGRAERSDLAKVMWQRSVLDRKGTDISGNHCELCIPVCLAENKAQVALAKALSLFRDMRAWCGCDVSKKKKSSFTSNKLSKIMLEAISKITVTARSSGSKIGKEWAAF